MAGEGHFIWYELMTSDPKAAGDFYEAVVGWKRSTFGGNEDYTIISAGEHGVGGIMAIPQEAKASGARPIWFGYVAVANTDAAVEAARAAGGSLHKGPWDIPQVGRLAMVADPQGAAYMLMTPDGQNTGFKPEPNAPGHAGWRELHTTDWEKAFAYYSGLYGWAKDQAMDMGEMGTYQIIADGGAQIGAMFNSPNVPHPMWLYYFNVASIDRAAEKVKAGGGQVINGPMEVPGGAWIINALDPQGAMFALVGAR